MVVRVSRSGFKSTNQMFACLPLYHDREVSSYSHWQLYMTGQDLTVPSEESSVTVVSSLS